MSEQKYDVIFAVEDEVRIEPHFCREWDEDGGCYGTNPEHGATWEQACESVVKYYESRAKHWRVTPEPTEEDNG